MTPRLAPSPFPFRRLLLPRRKSARSWLGLLCVAASLGVHGVLLALVMPGQESAPQPPAPPAETLPPPNDVAVTVLPRSEAVAPPSEAPPAPAVAPPAPTAPVAPTAAAPAAVAPPEAVVPPETPAALAPAVAPPPATLEPEPPAPFADFPHLAGAQATCPGLATCWRSPVSSSWRTAAGDLQDRLEAQGYRLSNVTGEVLAIDSGVRVYAVSKAGEPDYFLNLVSVSDGVLYTMTPEPMTTEQVLALQRS
ncbi:hypothetical protein [Nodosilinea sp. E11]|uniref:hypothetical protein n=1 Tax=Nodosilinea sp. E11 TaxID=3037479 RepID=UPI002934310E|nr:hypothetical protein [Nodosilinea sp. E11]WOD39557.1 hypothetical protein RRF56_25445 [Nodosilinea sp. E11]